MDAAALVAGAADEATADEVVREIELGVDADTVWQLVADREELAGWVGEEVRTARFDDHGSDDGGRAGGGGAGAGARRLRWTWAPEGDESSVELTVHRVDAAGGAPRTLVRVVERPMGPAPLGPTPVTAMAGLGWEARLFHLDLLCALAADLVPARR